MRKFLFLFLVVVFTGCQKEEPLETVRVIEIGDVEEYGMVNHYTVVEFPDGTRRKRSFHFGKVGDEFKARKAFDDSWR